MAELNLQHKINIPFAQNGDKDEIPDVSSEGLVNNTDGLGVKYETPIGGGGEYYDREIFNGVLYKIYAAVKELQVIAETAGFPIDMRKALNVLDIKNGGTGRKDGLSTGIKDRTVIDEDNWLTDNTAGTYSFFWQTADWKAKKLPNIVGSILQNNFAGSFKNALALDYAGEYAGIYDFKSNRWNKLAFDKDVINKMPKATSSSGIGKFQQVVGQGTPVYYRLPNGGTYLYFLSCTYDYNNYNAVSNKAGIAAGGTEIISTSMNLKTFGGFIWRIQ